MTATFEQLAGTETAVLSCLLNAPAKDITEADKLLPPFTNPALEWARQALAAAVDQDAPLWPVSIVAAANRAGLTTPPGLRQTPAAWLSEMMSTAPPPAMLWGLVDELEDADLRHCIEDFGLGVAESSQRGDLADQVAKLQRVDELIQRCRERIADAG